MDDTQRGLLATPHRSCAAGGTDHCFEIPGSLQSQVIKRFNFLFLNIVLSALLISACSCLAQTGGKPNIIWIVSEDNNAAMVGCYGNKFATTPNIDKLATEGIRFSNAFSTAPVCAPSRATLITGMYPPSLGTEHMRSSYPVPAFVKFFPRYLREAGYYTTNNSKKDYNTIDQPEAWDESSDKATYKNRKPGQPFFAVFNIFVTHESSIHKRQDSLRHDPDKVSLPPYHPDTKEIRQDWAQYYDKVETMDQIVGKLLKDLQDEGLADNTIVFYYSDNGGVLPRSKRFMYESGLHVPLIVRLPPKYDGMTDHKAGSTSDRLVTFTDFAPTVLSLAGIKIPPHMQGYAFMGSQSTPAQQYAYSFRGRMDERIDMSRTVRDKKYLYTRNYLPHLIYAQHLPYLWQSASMKSWEQAYRSGRLNATQRIFWEEKPAEELYDVEADPHNVNNLATDQKYRDVLMRMRDENHKRAVAIKDAGFIPEAILYRLSQSGTVYEQVKKLDLERIINHAEKATSRNPEHIKTIAKGLDDADASVRYWSAIACTILNDHAAGLKDKLVVLLQDREGAVKVAAAEALYRLGNKKQGMDGLIAALQDENPFVKVQAINVLQYLGKEALPALDAVKKLIPPGEAPPLPQDDNFDLRAARGLVETLEP